MSKQNENNSFVGILSLQFSWKMNNLSPYCGLVDAKIGASDKDLPVKQNKLTVVLFDEKPSEN